MFIKSKHQNWRSSAAATTLALGVALPLMMSAETTFAHHPSGTTANGTVGGIVTESASTLGAGQKAVSVVYEFVDLSRLSDENLEDTAAQGRDVHSLGKIQSATVAFFFGLTDFITIGAEIPWVSRSAIFEGEVKDDEIEVEKLGTAEGMGDLTLTGQVRLYQNPETGKTIAIVGGVKLPTGSTGDKDLEGHSFETEFQPGSGSVDLQLGGAVSHPMGPLSLDASTLYIFVNEGAQDVDLGDRFQYNAALAYRVAGESPGHAHDNSAPGHPHGPTLDLILELNGEWSDKEVDTGVTDPDTGGNTLYLSPGLRATGEGMAGFVSVGIPVSNNYNGIQSEPEWRILSGFSLSLP